MKKRLKLASHDIYSIRIFFHFCPLGFDNLEKTTMNSRIALTTFPEGCVTEKHSYTCFETWNITSLWTTLDKFNYSHNIQKCHKIMYTDNLRMSKLSCEIQLTKLYDFHMVLELNDFSIF